MAIAHNAKAFDFQFVFNRLVGMMVSGLIINGQKTMCLKLKNVTWVDSLN